MSESLFNVPAVFPFIECPNCKELLEVESKFCRRCREEIASDYALLSSAVIHYNTQACSLANSISTFDAFIPLAIIGSTFTYVSDLYVFGTPKLSFLALTWPAVQLLAITVWFVRFGSFKLGDEEFGRARGEMRRSFCFWLALLVVQVLVVTTV